MLHKCCPAVHLPLRAFQEIFGKARVRDSLMGDRLRDLLAVHTHGNSARGDAMAPSAALVEHILKEKHFAGRTQQDAAECLMQILLAADDGRM